MITPLPNLDPWRRSESLNDWRRYWNGDDLAAIISSQPNAVTGMYGWRVFAPESEHKWNCDGDALTVDLAKALADQHLRARFGVPKLEAP